MKILPPSSTLNANQSWLLSSNSSNTSTTRTSTATTTIRRRRRARTRRRRGRRRRGGGGSREMKQLIQQQYAARRSNSLRSGTASPMDGTLPITESLASFSFAKSPASVFWLVVHCLCCLISLVLGFRFSRLAFFLLFSPTSTYSPSTFTTLLQTAGGKDVSLPSQVFNHSRVVVGRHGIRIRPWPHPDPVEVMTAHAIIERVQKEQRIQYGVRNPRPVVAITPTYVRTFQTLHLTGLIHSLMLLPYDLTWIVVEAGSVTNETAALIASSGLKNVVHIGIEERMPTEWSGRHRLETKMRIKGLRVVRERKLDGIVVFTDDSNMHSMEMFDEIQKVKWFGALSVGILAHSGNTNSMQRQQQVQENEPVKENSLVPVQGPACNSSGRLVGWHTFNTLPYAENSATNVGDDATVLPTKLEWAGFVVNSRLLWKDAMNKPEWVRDLDEISDDEGIESPLALLKDSSSVEPLGNCGKKVMLWWLRVEARADSKFPPGWIIDPPLEIVVPAKRTPWPVMPQEVPSTKITTALSGLVEKQPKGKPSRPRRTSRNKRKHESQRDTQTAGAIQGHVQ